MYVEFILAVAVIVNVIIISRCVISSINKSRGSISSCNITNCIIHTSRII